tara:strand:+ start:707 stop:1030 length:324 start_codon:yes stop_codon:yes gene_type:complete
MNTYTLKINLPNKDEEEFVVTSQIELKDIINKKLFADMDYITISVISNILKRPAVVNKTLLKHISLTCVSNYKTKRSSRVKDLEQTVRHLENQLSILGGGKILNKSN